MNKMPFDEKHVDKFPTKSSLKERNATIFAKVWSAMQIRNEGIHTHVFI